MRTYSPPMKKRMPSAIVFQQRLRAAYLAQSQQGKPVAACQRGQRDHGGDAAQVVYLAAEGLRPRVFGRQPIVGQQVFVRREDSGKNQQGDQRQKDKANRGEANARPRITR